MMDDKPKAIMLELFPSVVTGDVLPKKYNEVLTVVTDQKIYIATDDPTGKERYAVAYESPIFDIKVKEKRKSWSVILDDENKTELTVLRSNGCGCGSRLRGVRMFRRVPYRRVV